MRRSYSIAIFLIFFWGDVIFAQETAPITTPSTVNVSDSVAKVDLNRAKQNQDARFQLPTIGLGLGMLNFYGDVSNAQKANGPLLGKVSYHLFLDQRLTRFLDARLVFIRGKVGANERSLARNINFESNVSMYGVHLNYNFDHLFPGNRYMKPYVTVGFEALEFLSKTDLYDANGNFYNYWSDGTIRDLAEDDINASNAIRLQRDYTYESDVRETSPDDLGKYSERSYAIPVGLGVRFEMTDRLFFDLSSVLHFTTTDFIDGITNQSIGSRQGTASNDKILHTKFGISYDLNPLINNADDIVLDPDDIMSEDMDGDGVVDFHDRCPNTPELVEVDEFGCPLDGDNDGVPDYKDDELDTPEGKLVKANGVAYTDADYLAMMLGASGRIDTIHTLTYSEGMDTLNKEKFMVHIGKFKGGVPQEVAEQLLSIPDVNTWDENGITYITVGNFDNIPDALRRQIELSGEGFSNTALVSTKQGSKPKLVSNASDYAPTAQADYFNPSAIDDPENTIVYRVQIGAYRNRISKHLFKDVPGVVMVPFEDDINRYYTGSYTSFDKAAEVRVDMIEKGYEGTFVSAFKNGERIALKDAGVNFVTGVDKIAAHSEPQRNAVNRDLVRFSVQIGAYSGEVPPEVLNIVLTLDNLKRERTTEGLVRYFSGSFKTLPEAQAFKQELIQKGLEGSEVIGRFKYQTITVQEALELLK